MAKSALKEISKVSKKQAALKDSQLALPISGEVLVLSIKKEWLLKIRSGKKKYEYRADKPFYNRIFSENFKWSYLVLSCGPYEAEIRQIKSISRVKTPSDIKHVVDTPECYAIEI